MTIFCEAQRGFSDGERQVQCGWLAAPAGKTVVNKVKRRLWHASTSPQWIFPITHGGLGEASYLVD